MAADKGKSIVLATIPSSRPGAADHRIMLDPNNTIFCTCEGWRFNDHSCPGLDGFRAKLMAEQREREG